jgi:hypothetical protein
MTLPLFGSVRLREAVFSECQRYRYLLKYPTDIDSGSVVLFALANPSKATAERTDPTVDKCIGYAKRWGFGWCWVVNARAWRATDPDDVPPDPLGIGPENDTWVSAAALQADLVVCGWGMLGGARGPVMWKLIQEAGKTPHALQINGNGSPTHPLYLAKSLTPFELPEQR